MYNNFCKTKLSTLLCLITAIALLIFPNVVTQILVLLGSGLIGMQLLASSECHKITKFQPSIFPLLLFAVLLFGLPIASHTLPFLNLFNHFFQAGSLVFGGGHVVLPLLQNIVGEQLTQDAFLTGYAAAQAVPGPMFTFATYIGFILMPQTPIVGALIATIGVFLPGFLLLLGVLKNWQSLAQKPKISGVVNGINASVVGLLIAALYQPVFISAVFNPLDVSLLLIGWYLLKQLQLSVIWMVIFFMLSGLLTGYLN